MSSPAPPPPMAPGTTVAGLTIESSGVIWWQWVTFFIVGNVFAGFWLVLALLNAHPAVAFKVRQLLGKLGLGGKKKAHHQHQSKEQEMQEQQQDGDAAKAAAAALAPAGAVPQLTLLTAGAAAGNKGPTPRQSTELGSPLRSHRSRPQPPPMLVVEQAISPRPSVTPKLSGLISPQASQPYSPGSHAGYATPRERGSFESEASAAAGGGAAAVGEDSDDTYTDESSLEGEPLLVKLEWRNLCYAVKAASGLRLIVQGIYGCANPQELQGLMGPSGAGKSTLMDLLSKRTDPAGSSQAAPQQTQQTQTQEGQHVQQQQQQQTRSSDGAASSVADGGTSSAASADAAVVHVAEEAAARKAAGGSSCAVTDQPSELLVNGASIGRKAFMKISAYVPQHDNLVPTMTAHEAVSFYASIILPPETSQHTKRARIARVLAMMGLTHAAHTLVGGALSGGILLRGLSGGEKKRLAIACGVVAAPSLVFLDEPTSGLDSFAALNVVLFIKSMATQGGGTLIASLHQPRSAIWGQLDQVTLLASGRLMYTGPTDALVSWFTSLGYAYSPSTHGMASDWALDLVSLGFTKPQSQTQQGAAQAEGEQQQGAGGSGLRHRLGGAHSSSSAALQQQQRASSSSVSMMSSKQELNDAAAAFLQHLAGLHPSWFQAAAAGGAPHKAVAAANGSLGNGMPALSPIRVTPAADQAAGVLGSDTAASPFLQQDSGDAVQQQQAAAQAQQLAALEQDQPGERGLLHMARGAWRKYKALLWRELLIATRNPADVGGRMMTFTYVSLLSGLISWNLPGGADSIMNRISVAYAVLSFYLLMPFVFMSLFTSDKRFFAVDTTARLYHPAQYYAAKVTITLPFNMLVAVVFHLIYYGMAGMRHGSLFMAQSCVVSLLMGVTAMQAVYCCAIVASSQDLAFVYAIAWTALNLLVNPYMALFNLYSLGWGVSWLRYLSPFNFAWQALVRIELAGRGFDCNSSSGLRVLGLIPDLLPQGPSFAMVRSSLANLASISTGRQCIASGDAVVGMYTVGLSFGATVGILLGYFLLFMAVTYYVVWKSSKQRGPTL